MNPLENILVDLVLLMQNQSMASLEEMLEDWDCQQLHCLNVSTAMISIVCEDLKQKKLIREPSE